MPTTLINDLSWRLESNGKELLLVRISWDFSKIRSRVTFNPRSFRASIQAVYYLLRPKKILKEPALKEASVEVLIGDDVPFDFRVPFGPSNFSLRTGKWLSSRGREDQRRSRLWRLYIYWSWWRTSRTRLKQPSRNRHLPMEGRQCEATRFS